MGLNPHIVDFSKIHKLDEDLVGRKVHELGMIWKLGIPLPGGFVITTQFYKDFIRMTGIDDKIKKTLVFKHPSLLDCFGNLFKPVQKQIMEEPMPQALITQLHNHYKKLSGIIRNRSLNVFSSSLNNRSILFNNVKGDANLILRIKTIWSLLPEEPVGIAVQKNIESKIKGIVFTDSPTADKRLTKQQADKLIEYCKAIQKHFYFPKEICYAVERDKIFITRVNPFTGTVTKPSAQMTRRDRVRKLLLKGVSINPGIVTGPVKILRNMHIDLDVKRGEIIVLPHLNPSLFAKIKNAKAVVVDSIVRNSLSETLYRKSFQIPTIAGAKNAAEIFQDGNVVTVNGLNGEVYSGGLIY